MIHFPLFTGNERFTVHYLPGTHDSLSII